MIYDIIQACYDLLVLRTTILGIQGQYGTAYIVYSEKGDYLQAWCVCINKTYCRYYLL